MARPQRSDPPGAIHHVMNRGVDRRPIFFSDADRTEFGTRLAEINERFGVVVHSYCLMSNHFHLLMRCPNGELSKAMQHLCGVYTRHTNDRVGRDGPLFRGRFRSIHVDDDAYLLTAIRYIHRNALDIAGISSVDGYRWSSHRAYLGMKRRPSFLDLSVLDDHFGGDVHAFHRFVARPWGRDNGAASAAELRCLAELAIAERETDAECETGTGLRSRTALLALVPSVDGPISSDLLAMLDDPSTSALGRARRRLATDDRFRDVVGAIAELGGFRSQAA